MKKDYTLSTNDLAVLAQSDCRALEALLLRLEGAARKAVSAYHTSSILSREDLLQDAYLGVVEKLDSYDKTKGSAVTFFLGAMRNEIWDDIRKHSHLVSIPFQKQTLLRSYEDLRSKNRNLDREELCALLHLSSLGALRDLEAAERACSLLSLDEPMEDGEEASTREAFVADSACHTEEDSLTDLEVERLERIAEKILSPLEKEFLYAYCGFLSEEYSPRKLSVQFGVSEVTVRNTLKRAIRKMQAAAA